MSKPVVLIVEDSAPIRKGLRDALRLNGYDVRECARGDEAVTRMMQTPLDLVLLDIMLPAVDGFTLLEELRRARPRLGVILLTARGAEDDRVRGLRLGADDYVVKPFSPRELLARVEAVLRRLAERPLDISSLEFAGRTIDLARREVLLPDGEIRLLSEREADLIRYLAVHRGRAVDRQELLQKVWGYSVRGAESRTVDIHIARLREKVEENPASPKLVLTVRSKGYMMARGESVRVSMATPRTWYGVFAAGTFLVLCGLWWLSSGAMRSERIERLARFETEQRTSLRLALWRLDAWMGGFLAREAARTPTEYFPGVAPSPLATFSSDYIQLHFQIDPAGDLSSPQASERGQGLARLARALDVERLRNRVAEAESLFAAQAAFGELRRRSLPPFILEFSHRAAAGTSCQLPAAPGTAFLASSRVPEEGVGPLIPLWLGPREPLGADTPIDFVFIRRLARPEGEYFQGFLGDWTPLRGALLTQLIDLFPEAELEPVFHGNLRLEEEAWGKRAPSLLATLPAALRVPVPVIPEAPFWTPTRSKLALVWLAVLIAVVAVSITLRSSVDFGQRRQRFASAVTHELRTPLTTFRMYTEMLADGTVREEALRQEYLETLQEESERLSGLVENVLTYAELEEGAGVPRQIERLRGVTLLERVVPPLARRAQGAGFDLEVAGESVHGTFLAVDVALVARLLLNLVDNACKYAAASDDRRINLRACVEGRHLVLRVRDHGPGVPRGQVHKIFKPFARHVDSAEGGPPGVGLGLALTRDLARASGGDLTCEQVEGGGACFELRLQAVP